MTIPYLSQNNLIVHPTKLVARIKGPHERPEATTDLGVIRIVNPDDTTLPRKKI